MPLRNSLSDYRYAYQGQEKDPETGKEAFQLRLWDARIGRWLTTDPYGEFHSPYLGMGNNPVSTIDLDGGCTDCSACPEACAGLNITSVPVGQGINYDFDSDTFSLIEGTNTNLLATVIVGDMTAGEFFNVGEGHTLDLFFGGGRNPTVIHDLEKRNEWRGIFDLTVASLSAGSSAAFPQVFTNTRGQAPRQFIGPKLSSLGDVIRRGVTQSGEARVVLQRGTRTIDITAKRVKEYVKNHRNPNSRYGDAVNFKKYGVPEGSSIIKGAGKGHKRTPTKLELDILNRY